MKSSEARPLVMHLAPGYYARDARLFHQECFSLKKAGYPVRFAAHPKTGDDFSGHDLLSLGPLGQDSWRLGLMDRFSRDYQAYAAALKSGAALFHVHSPEFIAWAIRLRRKVRRPLVFDIREDYVGYALQRPGIPESMRRSVVTIVKKQLEWAARNCDALILADDGTANGLTEHAKRTLVLYNFPRLEYFPFKEVIDEEKTHDIVHHGTMLRLQIKLCLGIDDALVRKGHRVRWRLISSGAPDMDWLREELGARGALERFTLDDRIPHEKIGSEVRKARIGISLFTGQRKFQNNIPRKIFEFMALGMPVVMADLPATRKFIRGNALAVTPDDCDAFADAIAMLLQNPSLSREMGRTGRELVETEYNWDRESQKLLDLYSVLLKA